MLLDLWHWLYNLLLVSVDHFRAFLSLSGLILSPTFLAHWQAQTPPSTSEADLNNTSGNLDPFKESSTKPSYSDQVENKSEAPLASNNTNGMEKSLSEKFILQYCSQFEILYSLHINNQNNFNACKK